MKRVNTIIIVILLSLLYACSTRPRITGKEGSFRAFGKAGCVARLGINDLDLKFFVKNNDKVENITIKFNDKELDGFYWICAVDEDFKVVHCQSSPLIFTENSDEFIDDGIFKVRFHINKDLILEDVKILKLGITTNHGIEDVSISLK